MLVNLHRIVDTAIHYMVSPTQPFPQIEQLIAQENYFVIHAPRQTGKSTAMLALAQQLTASDRYTSMMVSVEVGSPFSNDIHKAEVAIWAAKRQQNPHLPATLPWATWLIARMGGWSGYDSQSPEILTYPNRIS
jgi:hypothetical protein